MMEIDRRFRGLKWRENSEYQVSLFRFELEPSVYEVSVLAVYRRVNKNCRLFLDFLFCGVRFV
jgi:hypothetical protein